MNRVKKAARLYLQQRPAIDIERQVYRNRREANRKAGRPTAPVNSRRTT